MIKNRRKKIQTFLYDNRYEFLLVSILMIVFDSLFFTDEIFFQSYVWPLNMLFFGVNASNVITSKRRKYFNILLIISILTPFIWFFLADSPLFARGVLLVYILLYGVVLENIIESVFKSRRISFDMVLGTFCGYLLVGLIATFLNLVLLSYMPDAIEGLAYFSEGKGTDETFTNVLYYSFVTMTSIGYGDFLPINSEAKLLSVLIGVTGQFYMTIIVALIIGKYLNNKIEIDKNEDESK